MTKEDFAYMVETALKKRVCSRCYWRNREKFCTNEKINDYGGISPIAIDELRYSYHEGGGFEVGDNFGCVHFKDDIKDENEKARYEKRTRK
jgi:hypothetical protein